MTKRKYLSQPPEDHPNPRAARMYITRRGRRSSPRRAAQSLEVRKARFIHYLVQTATVYHACRRAQVSKILAYRWRLDDPDFADAWDQAIEHSIQNLETAAYEKAIAGDSLLMMFLLKARRPEVYREKFNLELDLPQVEDEIRRRLANMAPGGQAAIPQLPPASPGGDDVGQSPS